MSFFLKIGYLSQMEIGEQIRALRKKRGLTQAELAEKVGLSFTGAKSKVISDYETGRRNPSHPTLQKIAEALQVKIIIKLEEA